MDKRKLTSLEQKQAEEAWQKLRKESAAKKKKFEKLTEANYGLKREEVKVVLREKGMDTQQVEQAIVKIDSIFWGV